MGYISPLNLSFETMVEFLCILGGLLQLINYCLVLTGLISSLCFDQFRDSNVNSRISLIR